MEDCLFCRIIRKEIPADIIFENEKIIAFRDINPKAPTHILIVPKEHISTVLDLTEKNKDVVGDIYLVVQKLAKLEKIALKGFRTVVNCNADAGQEVFHIHFHLLGGRVFKWPPG